VSPGSVSSTSEASFPASVAIASPSNTPSVIGTDPESVAELAAAPKQGPPPHNLAPSQAGLFPPTTSMAANAAPLSLDSVTSSTSKELNCSSTTVVAGAARKMVWSSPSPSPWKYSNSTGKVAPSQGGLLNPPTGSQSNSPASSGDYSAPSSCESIPSSTSKESNCSSATVVAGAARKSLWSSPLPWKYSNGTGKVAPSQGGLLNLLTGS
jgi:hypothetical protein